MNRRPRTLSSARQVKQLLSDPVFVCAHLGLLECSRPQARGVMIRCPSGQHADVTPSCSVRALPDGEIRVRCFSCTLRGDVLTLIAAVHRLPLAGAGFRQVLRLAEELVVQAPMSPLPAASIRPEHREEHRVVASVMLEMAPLSEARSVALYLGTRGVLDDAIADGWGGLPDDEDALDTLIGAVCAACGQRLVERSGLVRDGRLLFSQHRMLIPWRRPDGELDVLQRRHLGDGDGRRYILPAGISPRWPYGVHRAGENPALPIVLVEGAIDVLAQRRASRIRGLNRLILGLPGVTGWRSQWATLAAGRDVAIALDNDAAGTDMAPLLQRELLEAGAREVHRVVPRCGSDWNEGMRNGIW